MKVGEYVRTKDGCIAKFEGINESFYEFDNIIMDESTAVRDELFVDIIEKSSPSIIDLIEVGDYVNGFKVEDVYKPEGTYVLWLTLSCNPIDRWKNEDIKSVITREQMKSLEYKVKE